MRDQMVFAASVRGLVLGRLGLVVVLAMVVAACGGATTDDAAESDVTTQAAAATTVDEMTEAEETPTQPQEPTAADEPAETSAAPAGETETLRVAYLPVTGAAPLFAGIDQGFYADEGIEIEAVETPAASLVPGLVSGEVDMAYVGTPPSILGRAAGLPIKAVAPIVTLQTDPAECILQALVAEDSDIQTAADLEGRTVAVDALFQLPHLSLIHAAESLDADPDAFEFIEIPFPAMVDAIGAGDVDAIVPTEPFLTIAMNQGYRPVMSICDGWPEDSTAAYWGATEEFIGANADLIERFQRASAAAADYTNDNPDAIRDLIPEFTPVDAELASEILLPTASGELNRESFEIYAGILEGIGQLDEGFDIDQMFIG